MNGSRPGHEYDEMILRQINRRPVERTFQWVAVLIVVSLSSGCNDDAPDKGPPSGGPMPSVSTDGNNLSSAKDAELTQPIQAFCGACHAVPAMPCHCQTVFRSRHGTTKLNAATTFTTNPVARIKTAASDCSGFMVSAAAPGQLAEPDQTEALNSPLEFKLRMINVPVGSTEPAAVSVVRLADSSSSPSRVRVSDMRRGVVSCDVNDPSSAEAIRIGSNPAGTCDVDLDQNGSMDLVVAE